MRAKAAILQRPKQHHRHQVLCRESLDRCSVFDVNRPSELAKGSAPVFDLGRAFCRSSGAKIVMSKKGNIYGMEYCEALEFV